MNHHRTSWEDTPRIETPRGVSDAESTWWLTGRLSEREPIRQVCIDRSPFVVGRENGLALTIPRATVSSRHSEFVLEDENLFVRDLGSTNGTFVNGNKIVGNCVLKDGDLLQFAEVVFRVGVRSTITELETLCGDGAERAMALIQFDRLMAERAVTPFVQPIVTLKNRSTVGYELLARSRFYGLTEPKSMFHAAALLDAEAELSRLLRTEGMRVGQPLPMACGRFLNTHPNELVDPEVLVLSLRELREAYPEEPIVLEIHEASVTNPEVMKKLKTQLIDVDIQLAYDDFGAGQARLAELIEVPPDYLKYDLNLIRAVESADSHQRRMLRVLVEMVRDIGVVPIAEGIETQGADEACRELGFELGQGFYYGKPARTKHYVLED